MADTSTSTVASSAAGEAPPLSMQKQMTDTLIFLGLLFAVFYFILIRPQQKRLKAHQAMLQGVQKGSRIVTAGGILGTVTKLEGEDIAVVEVAQGVKVRVARSTISEVLKDNGKYSETANDN